MLLLILYIGLHSGAAIEEIAGYKTKGVDSFGAFFSALEKRITESPFDFTWSENSAKILAICVFAWFIGSAYYFTTRRKYIFGKEFGTAEWSSEKDISGLFAENIAKAEIRKAKGDKEKVEAIKRKYADADALFTKTERISIYNFKLNNNTLILGGSGSGKTRGFVMPNILQAHSSFVITDPKGEILEKAGYFLETVKGYKLRVLNLDNKAASDFYNPFAYVHPERAGYEERVLMLIEAIILNTDGGEKKGGSDPFWDKAERLFLQAIFFFTCDGFSMESRNMNTVLALIGMLTLNEEQDDFDSDLDYFAKIFEEMHGSEHIGVQQFKEFRQKASGKTAKSIVISAVARLAPFRTTAVRRIFGHDSMALDRLGEEKTAVFVVVPPTDTTFNFIAGMLFTQMFQELQYCATEVHKHHGQRLPVPVRFILDEFANTCTIPNFVKILAYARSFGIGIVPILQSLEQIKNMYKDEWGVIVDNCNTLLYLGSITHMDTLEYISKLLGKGTFDKRTTGHSKGKQGSSNWNFDVIGRELMDASEIRKIPKENCLFMVGGRNPFYSLKYDYPNHPNYRYTSDGDPSLSYEYVPAPPPSADREVEFSPHGEDITAEAGNAFAAVMAEVNGIEPIEVIHNQQVLLSYLAKNVEYLTPVSDALLSADDGEPPEGDFLSLLDDTEAEAEAAEMLRSMTQQYMDKTMGQVNSEIEENGIRLGGVIDTAAAVLRIGKYLAPTPDELLSPDDGEIGMDIFGIVLDETDNSAVSSLDTEFADLSSLIDSLQLGETEPSIAI